MALLAAAPEPMNATTNHSKIRVGITLPGENVLAGRYVTGKMEVECKSDKLGIGIIMVELFAFQELTSRDHSARMTFLHSRRLFQGPNLPPSNAVYAFPIPGDTDTPTLPEDYYKAKRGTSTFLFRIPLPLSSPASVNFANGLAGVRYEVRGSVGVFWKGEKQLVMDKDEVGVLESYSEDLFGFGVGSRVRAEEGVVVVGENGRFWMHARIVGGLIVAGESACVELQVKNHSSRKNSGLVVALNRNLVLPSNSRPLQISDTILTVPFKGQEYILPPGAEGVAHLVFDVPLSARSVKGGEYEGDGDEEGRKSDALFSIQASVEVKVVMGLGSKDIVVEIPVTIVHPSALPELPPQPGASEPMPVYPQYTSIPPAPHSQQPYIDPNTQQIWIPPPGLYHNQYYQQPAYYSPQAVHSPPQQPLIYSQHQHENAYTHLNLNLAQMAPRQLPARPSSAGPSMTASPGHGAGSQNAMYGSPISGLPSVSSGEVHARLLPLPGLHAAQTPPRTHPTHFLAPVPLLNATQSPVSPTHNHNRYETSPGQGEPSPSQAIQGEREEGKGVVASRISRHLRQSSVQQGRGRSVSPVAHRFWYPASSTVVGGGVGAAVIGVDGLLVGGSGDVPNDAGDRGAGGDLALHSPRPQIRHKQSFTSGLGVVTNRTGGNEKEVVMRMMRSESVVELEKIAAGLSDDNNNNKDGVVKPHILISTSTDAVDVNKTLPPPPIATKPHQHDSPGNAAAPLEWLFDPPSPSPLPRIPSSQDLGTRDILPPTPTLMAVKRPSKLAVPVNSGIGSASASASGPGSGDGGGRGRGTKVGRGGGGIMSIGRKGRGGGGRESGLDALERRLQAQVGTRKPEKEKKPDVRDILLNVKSNSDTRPKLQSLALPTTGGGGPDEVLREGNRTPTYTNVDSSVPPSTSSTPNLEGGKLRNGTTGTGTGTGTGSVSSERMAMLPDESAISSLTLDRSGSSGGGDDEANYKEEGVGSEGKDGSGEHEEEMEMEMEQESVDGGKTHRAEKSVVGAESYFQSRNHQPPPPQQQQQHGQHKRVPAVINSSPSRHPYPSSKSSSQRPPLTATTATTPKKPISSSTSTTSNGAKSKKSAQRRGRVTAWLGKIDPDAPPPQEQIIPPSPSVVKPVEWEEIMFSGGDEGEESDFVPVSDAVVLEGGVKELERGKGKGREGNRSRIRTNAARPRSRSRSRSPPPFQPPELISSPPPAQTLPPPTRIRTISQTVSPSSVATTGGGTAASPNPRSSGFMPIETMKAQRDTVTQSMSRSVLRRAAVATAGGAGAGGAGGARNIGREASVVKEARMVMDIWSEGLPSSSSSSPATQRKREEVEKEGEVPSVGLVKPGIGVVDSPTPVTKFTNVNGNANKEDKGDEKGKKNVNANVKKYPFMVLSPPKTQSIRTDRGVSPPSVSTIGGGGGGAKRSIPQVIEPRSIPTFASLAPPASSTTIAPTVPSPNVNKPTNQRLTPSPISYANVAASRASASPTSTSTAAAQPMKEKKLLNQNQRSQLSPPPQKLPVFPAPPPTSQQRQDQEEGGGGNKYDVKSARGGRGGQVSHVASLWASVAAGNAGGDGGGGGKAKVGAGAGMGVKKDVKGVGMTSTASPFKGEEIKTQRPVVRGRPSLYPPPKSNSTTPATTGSNVDDHDVKQKKPVNGPPLLLPKKPSFTTVVASSPSTSPGETMAERIRLQSKTPTPPLSSKPGKPPTIPTPTTKPRVSLVPSSTTTTTKTLTASKPISKSSSPPSTTNNRPDKPKGTPPSLPTINAMAKSTSVPALVSSSLATPTLSSTASLVRPVGRSGSRTATVPVGMPGIGKGDYKSVVVGGGREGGGGEGGVNGVKVGGVVRKRLGVVGEEDGAQAQAPMKSKVVSPGQGIVSAPIAAVSLPKPNAATAAASSTPAEGMENVKRPPSFGQARLRDLIKKYQGGDP